MSCTITHELSVDGNLLVYTKKEGTRVIGTDKILINTMVLYIDYLKKEIRIDALNNMHNKTHWALSGDTTYVGDELYTGEGDTTAVTLPCGTVHTPTQAFADLLLFVNALSDTAMAGSITTHADWQADQTAISYQLTGNSVTLTMIDVLTAQVAPSAVIGTLPSSVRPSSTRYVTAFNTNTNAATLLSIGTNGAITVVSPAAAQNDVLVLSTSYLKVID
jgi:hypothetical protein